MTKNKVLLPIVLVVAVLVFAGVAYGTPAPKVNWCHTTSSEGNPYEAINVSGNAAGHQDHEGDFYYQGPLNENDQPTKEGDQWCEDNAPKVVDVCINVEGNQSTVPEGYVEKDSICNQVVVEEPVEPPVVTPLAPVVTTVVPTPVPQETVDPLVTQGK